MHATAHASFAVCEMQSLWQCACMCALLYSIKPCLSGCLSTLHHGLNCLLKSRIKTHQADWLIDRRGVHYLFEKALSMMSLIR